MAEISALTLELNLETEGLDRGLKEIKSKFLSVLGSIDGSGSRVGSTFEGITNQLQSLGKELSTAGKGVSTLENSAGTGLASSFNQASESLDKLQQTIAILQSLSVEIDIEIPISNVTQAQESTNSLRDSFKGIENEIGNSGIAGIINQITEAFKRINENNPELLQTFTIISGIAFAFVSLLRILPEAGKGLALVAGALGVSSGTVVLAVAAIAALAAGIIVLIQNWDALVLAAQVTWEENIVPIIESAANAIGGIIGAVGQFIEETFNTAINFISEKWTSFINFISENVPLVGKLIEGLTPDPDAAQNHPFFKAVNDNPDLNKGGLLGLKDIKLTPQQLEAAKMWAGVNREIEQSAKGASEAMGNMSSGVKEAGDQTEKVGIKVKITSGNLSTFDTNAGGALNTVDQLTGGLNKQLPKLDLQREALDKNGDELKELEEKARKAEEALKKFEDLQFSLLPESDQERIRLQETLDFLDEFAEKRKDLEQEIASVRVQVTEEANKKIQDLERKEYIQRLKDSGSFVDGLKAGFLEFVDQVENNSELISQFFADTLSQMSQNFSDLFFNLITGKFDDLADLAKQAFEAILRAFLDLVSAIVTKQIVISIAGVFGFGKGASAGDVLGFGKQAAGIGADLAGIFGGGGGAAGGILGGGAAIGGGISAIGAGAGAAGGATSVGASLGLTGISSVGTGAAGGATGVGASLGLSGISSVPTAPGFLAGIGGVAGAITIVGAVLAAAALAFTIIAPFLKKTPRLDIDFDSVKTEAGRRAALVSELLDDDFLKDEIIDISVKRKAGLGLGGDEGIKDVLADAIQGAVNNLLDIINKLPTDLADTLTEELLNTPLDTETEVAGERLFEFDAKGKKIAEKFNQLINGEIQAKFLFAVDGFLQTMFESLGVLPEAAEAFFDERFEEFKNAGSREARAKVGQELLADINAFVDAFNIVSGNVNDAIGQTIREDEVEYRLAA